MSAEAGSADGPAEPDRGGFRPGTADLHRRPATGPAFGACRRPPVSQSSPGDDSIRRMPLEVRRPSRSQCEEACHAPVSDPRAVRSRACELRWTDGPRRPGDLPGDRPDRRAQRRDRAEGRRLAPRHPPEPGARQPGDPHRGAGGRPPEGARLPGDRRRRRHRRRRRAGGRPAGAGRGAARRHGRAAGRGAGRPALRLEGPHRVGRRGGRRDARLRPRRPHRDPDGRRRGARRHEGRACPAR